MDDSHVGTNGRDGRESFAGERACDGADARVDCGQVSPQVGASHRAGQSGHPGGVGRGHGRVAVLLDLDGVGPAALDRGAEAVERSDAGVPAPREDDPPGAPHSDHLVVDQIRSHPDEGQVAAPLPDDLVPGSERDEVGEPLHRDDVAIAHVRGDRVAEGQDVSHRKKTVSRVASPWRITSQR